MKASSTHAGVTAQEGTSSSSSFFAMGMITVFHPFPGLGEYPKTHHLFPTSISVLLNNKGRG